MTTIGHSSGSFVAARLPPRTDLRLELEALARRESWTAAAVISAVGSLSRACLRFAGRDEATILEGDLEVVSLSGTVGPDGAHLHAMISDAAGRAVAGHVAPGCTVRTTLEIVLVVLPQLRFDRIHDPGTGSAEVVIVPYAAP